MGTMKAVAVFPGRRELRVIEHPEPAAPAAGEVELEVVEVGVCGTDREIAAFAYGTPPPGADHLVIGHECLGRVRRTGPGVAGLAEGQLAVPRVRYPCPHPGCGPCRAGRPDFCRTGDYTERGIRGRHGFMTERVVVDADKVAPVPEEIAAVAALTEPLTIAEKALIEVTAVQKRLPVPFRHRGLDAAAEPQPRHRALVLGAGPVGLLGAMALRVRDFETWVLSREPADSPRARIAGVLGAHYLVAGEVDLTARGEGIGPFDLIYEATGASQAAFAATAALGPNGIFVLTGVPGLRGPVEIDADAVMRRLVLENQVLLGTVNAGPDAFAAAVSDLGRFLDRWPQAVPALISGRHAPERAPALLASRSGGIKELVRFAAPGRPVGAA